MASYDHVVEGAHVDEFERLLEASGQCLVRFTRLGVSTRMVVGEEHCRCVEAQGLLHYFAGVHRGRVDRAANS